MNNNDGSDRKPLDERIFRVTEGRRPLPMTPLAAENTAVPGARPEGLPATEDRGRRPVPMTPAPTTSGEKPAQPPAAPAEDNRPKD